MRSKLAQSILSVNLGSTTHRFTSTKSSAEGEETVIVEMRQLFLELLTEAYEKMMKNGELDSREDRGYNHDVLKQSVAFALAAINDGPINDWEYTNMFPFHRDARAFLRAQRLRSVPEFVRLQLRSTIVRSVCFAEGHRIAEAKLQNYVTKAEPELTKSGTWPVVENALNIVLEESQVQVAAAQERAECTPDRDMVRILSHYVSSVLLRRLIAYVETNAADEVLSSQEAHRYLDDLEQALAANLICCSDCHNDDKSDQHNSGLEDCCLNESGSQNNGDGDRLMCVQEVSESVETEAPSTRDGGLGDTCLDQYKP